MNKLVCVASALMVVGSVNGEMVSGWEITGVDVDGGDGIVSNIPPYQFLATTNETGHVSSRLSLGAGVLPSTSKDQYGFKIPGDQTATVLEDAIDRNHYLECALEIEAGFALNLDRVEMVGESTGTGCSNIVFMTSIDGFLVGQQIASVTNAAGIAGGFDTDKSGFGGPIDLSASRYQNLTGTVLFRLYGWSSTSGTGTTRLRSLSGNDFSIYGSVEALEAKGPMLEVSTTNGTPRILARFSAPSDQNHILQYRSGLSDSNEWASVSTAFSEDLSWSIVSTNKSGFYRTIASEELNQ